MKHKNLNKMKIIHCNLIFKTVIAAACFAVGMIACDDMNSLHEKYLDRGMEVYIGAVDSLSVQPGLNKIGFKWKINADPRINKIVISWEESENSVMVKKDAAIPVVRTTEGEMWMEHILYDIPEAEYIFKFQIFDSADANSSKTVEVSGNVLGDVYVENLRNRNFKQIAKLETGEMQIDWELASSGTLLYTVVEYVNTGGETVSVEVPNNEERTLLEGLETGDEIELYTVHFPENGLETFRSIGRNYFMPKFERLIDKSRFAAAFKPGDNTTPHPGGSTNDWTKPITDFSVGNRNLAKIWDGGAANASNNRSILHSEDQSGNANATFKYPHHFTFDMGAEALLSRFKIWARSDNGAYTGHSPRFFELWATDAPKEIEDFSDLAAFEKYYRTTYVVQKNPANYADNNNADNQTKADPRCVNNNYLAPEPEPGIHNWQQDWVKLGDFEIVKPSGLAHNSSNDADKALWGSGSTNSPEALETCGFSFPLPESTQKYRYIRLVIKFPNWDNTNCINLGEVSFYGDDI
jgi:hypothetical protein